MPGSVVKALSFRAILDKRRTACHDRPTTSDLRRLLAPFSEPPTTSGKQSWQEALRGMSLEQAQRAGTWTFASPGLRNRTERHRIQAVTMFTRRSGT